MLPTPSTPAAVALGASRDDFATVLTLEPVKSADRRDRQHPLDDAGCASAIMVSWFSPLVWAAYRKPVQEKDVWPPPRGQCPEVQTRAVWAAWGAQAEQRRRPSLVRVLLGAFWWHFLLVGLFIALFACSMLVQPFLVRGFLDFLLAGPESPVETGVAYASAIFVCSAFSSFLIVNFARNAREHGTRVRTALMCVIFQHSMELSAAGRAESSVGQTTNLMAVDTEKIYMAALFCHFVWVTPAMTAAVGVLLAVTVGPSALAGLFFIMVLWPLQIWLAKKGAWARRKAMVFTDERVKFVTEVVRGIRFMKLCAWEDMVSQRAHGTRKQEVHWLSISIFFKTVTREGILILLPPATLAIMFAITRAQGVFISEALALTALGFLNTLRFPFNLFAESLAASQDAMVSIRRIESFLQRPVVERGPPPALADVASVAVSGAQFTWSASPSEADFRISIDQLHLEGRGKVAVVGCVAAGKTSLLAALLGEMRRTRGTCALHGRVAYMGQTPWIQNMSLRDNVIFGHEFNEKQYWRVVAAAALKPDLAILKDGDLTEIGERGINLSGGQKARVCLARCFYAVAMGSSDVIILDCPFDALDVPTGQQVFDRMGDIAQDALLICSMSAQIHLLPHFDKIIVMRDGQLSMVDTFPAVAEHYPELVGGPSGADASTAAVAEKDREGSAPAKPQHRDPVKLVRKDTSDGGDASWRMMLTHLGGALNGGPTTGLCVGATVLAIFFLGQACRVAADVLLTMWASGDMATVLVFAFFGACVVLLTMRTVSVVVVNRRASMALHRRTFWHMLRAPVIEYFDVTTNGEIANKFSKDLETTDTVLPTTCIQLFSNCCQLITVVVLATYAIPWFLAVLALLSVIFFYIARVFGVVSRELKRLDSATRSPIYNSFSETLSGLDTIRAWRAQDRFLADFIGRARYNLGFLHAVSMSECWVMSRLEVLTFTIIGAFAFSAVVMHGRVEPRLVGLTQVYALQLTALLQRTIQLMIMLGQQMTSCERVLKFRSIPQEPPLVEERDKALPPDWPRGEVVFENVQMRYRDGDLVLKDVSFAARPGERVGICGRTGAGKTSLIGVLFRVAELCGGKICIDGVNIQTLGLRTLRSNLSIIPQDPVIFSGPLRLSLDPFGKVGSDQVLADVMRRVGLSDLVNDFGLDAIIAEHGENLSVGQRQLLCIARVMLQRTQITVLDEATSAMDAATDQAVQAALAEHWRGGEGGRGKTVLTIAHRLSTIMDYDRILVLAFGEVVEFDTPSALSSRPGGALAQMLRNERKEPAAPAPRWRCRAVAPCAGQFLVLPCLKP